MRRRIVPDIVQQQEIYSLTPDISVRDAAKMMSQRRIGAVMVMEGGQLRGIFSERDLITRVVARDLDPDTTRIDAVMTPDPVTIGPGEPPGTALDMMRENGFRHLPITDGDRVVGMVSIRDLYQAVHAQLEEDIQERDAYMFGSGYGATA